MLDRLSFRAVASGLLLPAMLFLLPRPATAGIREVQVDSVYVPAGDKVVGRVLLAPDSEPTAGVKLRVTVVRQNDVPAKAGTEAGATSEKLIDRPLAMPADATRIPLEINTTGMLRGTVRIKAELVVDKATEPLSVAWSAPDRSRRSTAHRSGRLVERDTR